MEREQAIEIIRNAAESRAVTLEQKLEILTALRILNCYIFPTGRDQYQPFRIPELENGAEPE